MPVAEQTEKKSVETTHFARNTNEVQFEARDWSDTKQLKAVLAAAQRAEWGFERREGGIVVMVSKVEGTAQGLDPAARDEQKLASVLRHWPTLQIGGKDRPQQCFTAKDVRAFLATVL